MFLFLLHVINLLSGYRLLLLCLKKKHTHLTHTFLIVSIVKKIFSRAHPFSFFNIFLLHLGVVSLKHFLASARQIFVQAYNIILAVKSSFLLSSSWIISRPRRLFLEHLLELGKVQLSVPVKVKLGHHHIHLQQENKRWNFVQIM